jgi:hypothetical protein
MNAAIQNIIKTAAEKAAKANGAAGAAKPVSEASKTLRMAIGKGTSKEESSAGKVEAIVEDGMSKAIEKSFYV